MSKLLHNCNSVYLLVLVFCESLILFPCLCTDTSVNVAIDAGLYTHKGMYESAEALLPHVTAAIHAAQSREAGKYKDYEVVVTGHSLGGGVACLLALLLSIKSLIPSTTFAFAPPPTLSVYDLSPGSTLHELTSKAPVKMHSFVHNEDVITRCSYREMMHLLGSLAAIDCMKWSPLKRSTIILRGYLTPEEQLDMQIALLPLMQDEKRMRRHAPAGDMLRQKINKVRDMMRLLDPSRQESADTLAGEVTNAEHHKDNFHEVRVVAHDLLVALPFCITVTDELVAMYCVCLLTSAFAFPACGALHSWHSLLAAPRSIG